MKNKKQFKNKTNNRIVALVKSKNHHLISSNLICYWNNKRTLSHRNYIFSTSNIHIWHQRHKLLALITFQNVFKIIKGLYLLGYLKISNINLNLLKVRLANNIQHPICHHFHLLEARAAQIDNFQKPNWDLIAHRFST